jgi:hypothetical protein
MPVDGIPTIGRNTQGVRLIRLDEQERVVAMERIAEKEEGERVESPEVAAARAEALSQPLAEEDLGEEAAVEEDDSDDGLIDDLDPKDDGVDPVDADAADTGSDEAPPLEDGKNGKNGTKDPN